MFTALLQKLSAVPSQAETAAGTPDISAVPEHVNGGNGSDGAAVHSGTTVPVEREAIAAASHEIGHHPEGTGAIEAAAVTEAAGHAVVAPQAQNDPLLEVRQALEVVMEKGHEGSGESPKSDDGLSTVDLAVTPPPSQEQTHGPGALHHG